MTLLAIVGLWTPDQTSQVGVMILIALGIFLELFKALAAYWVMELRLRAKAKDEKERQIREFNKQNLVHKHVRSTDERELDTDSLPDLRGTDLEGPQHKPANESA